MKKSMSVLMAGSMLVSSVVSANPIAYADEKLDYTRLSGLDRYETCARICKDKYEKSEVAIIASGEIYPDALSSGALSIKEKAPLLLVKKDEIPKSIQKELDRLGVKKVIIVGGEHTINSDIFSKYKVERIAGADRYKTSLEVAKRTGFEKNIIVSGKNYADALVATSLAAKLKMNIILTDGKNLDASLNQDTNIILGGTASVNIPGIKGDRIAGRDRYETSLKVAQKYFNESKKSILASGTVFADSLSSVSIVSKTVQPIILIGKVDPAIAKYAKKYIEKKKIEVTVVGGNATLPEKVLEKIIPVKEEKNTTSSGGSSGGGSSSKPSKKPNKPVEKVALSDGVYYGSAKGFRTLGCINCTRRKVIETKVTVENHKIKNIEITKFFDDKDYKPIAQGFLEKFMGQIKENDTIGNLLTKLKNCLVTPEGEKDPDVASGATYSNIGVMIAVENAINASKYKTQHNEVDNSRDLILVDRHDANVKIGEVVNLEEFTLERRFWDNEKDKDKIIEFKDLEKEGIKLNLVVDYYHDETAKRTPLTGNTLEITEDMITKIPGKQIVVLEFVDTKTGKIGTKALEVDDFKTGVYKGTGSGYLAAVKHENDKNYEVDVTFDGRNLTGITISKYGDDGAYKDVLDNYLAEISSQIKEKKEVDELIDPLYEELTNPTEQKELYAKIAVLNAIDDAIHNAIKVNNTGEANYKGTVLVQNPDKVLKIGDKITGKDLKGAALERVYWDNSKDQNQRIEAKDFVEQGIWILAMHEPYSNESRRLGWLDKEETEIEIKDENLTTLEGKKYLAVMLIDSSTQKRTILFWEVKATEPTPDPVEEKELQDGVFYGKGDGHKGDKNTEVKVTIENHKIKNIELTEFNDDSGYDVDALRWLKEKKLDEIKKTGSVTNLLKKIQDSLLFENRNDPKYSDVRSGATRTSRGIVGGIAEALEKSRNQVVESDIKGISIATNPKTRRIEFGDELDLSKFSIRISYKDGSNKPEKIVPFSELAANNIEVNIPNGTVISKKSNLGLNQKNRFKLIFTEKTTNSTAEFEYWVMKKPILKKVATIECTFANGETKVINTNDEDYSYKLATSLDNPEIKSAVLKEEDGTVIKGTKLTKYDDYNNTFYYSIEMENKGIIEETEETITKYPKYIYEVHFTKEAPKPDPDKPTEKVALTDGEFYGSAKGFRTKGCQHCTRRKVIETKVTVENHKIKNIEITKFFDDKDYQPIAQGFLEKFMGQIKENDTIGNLLTKLKNCLVTPEGEKDPDVASGATYSNIGVMMAVENAINASKYETIHHEKDNSRDLILPFRGSEEVNLGDEIDMNAYTIERRFWDNEKDQNKLIPFEKIKEEGIEANIIVDYYHEDKAKVIPITKDKFIATEDLITNTLEQKIIVVEFTDTKTGKKAKHAIKINNVEDGKYKGTGEGYLGEIKVEPDKNYEVEVEYKDNKIKNISISKYGDNGKYKSELDAYLSEILPSIKENSSVNSYYRQLINSITNPTEQQEIYAKFGLISAIDNALSNAIKAYDVGKPVELKRDVIVKEAKTLKKGAKVSLNDLADLVVERQFWTDKEAQRIGFENFGKEGIRFFIFGDYYGMGFRRLGELAGDKEIELTDDVLTTIGEEKFLTTIVYDSKENAQIFYLWKVENTTTPDPEPEKPEPVANPEFKDGEYFGIGDGWRSNIGKKIKMKVTIKDQKIENIEIVDFGDDVSYKPKAMRFFNQFIEEIKQKGNTFDLAERIQAALDNPSLESDVQTGATYSNRGIIQGINIALENSKKAKLGEDATVTDITFAKKPASAVVHYTDKLDLSQFALKIVHSNPKTNPDEIIPFDQFEAKGITTNLQNGANIVKANKDIKYGEDGRFKVIFTDANSGRNLEYEFQAMTKKLKKPVSSIKIKLKGSDKLIEIQPENTDKFMYKVETDNQKSDIEAVTVLDKDGEAIEGTSFEMDGEYLRINMPKPDKEAEKGQDVVERFWTDFYKIKIDYKDSEPEVDESELIDGTFKGTGDGYYTHKKHMKDKERTIDVAVTIKNKKIDKVDIIQYGDTTAEYGGRITYKERFDRFKEALDAVLKGKEAIPEDAPDTKTGATYTSRAYEQAINDALNASKYAKYNNGEVSNIKKYEIKNSSFRYLVANTPIDMESISLGVQYWDNTPDSVIPYNEFAENNIEISYIIENGDETNEVESITPEQLVEKNYLGIKFTNYETLKSVEEDFKIRNAEVNENLHNGLYKGVDGENSVSVQIEDKKIKKIELEGEKSAAKEFLSVIKAYIITHGDIGSLHKYVKKGYFTNYNDNLANSVINAVANALENSINSVEPEPENPVEQLTLKDGIFIGHGYGHHLKGSTSGDKLQDGIKVDVEFKDNKIVKIALHPDDDTYHYGDDLFSYQKKALNIIPLIMNLKDNPAQVKDFLAKVEAETSDPYNPNEPEISGGELDVVSGATRSARGITRAVVDAIEKAKSSVTENIKTEVKIKPIDKKFFIGDKLNLNDLSVHVKYSDDTEEDVNYADFAKKGLKVEAKENKKPIEIKDDEVVFEKGNTSYKIMVTDTKLDTVTDMMSVVPQYKMLDKANLEYRIGTEDEFKEVKYANREYSINIKPSDFGKVVEFRTTQFKDRSKEEAEDDIFYYAPQELIDNVNKRYVTFNARGAEAKEDTNFILPRRYSSGSIKVRLYIDEENTNSDTSKEDLSEIEKINEFKALLEMQHEELENTIQNLEENSKKRVLLEAKDAKAHTLLEKENAFAEEYDVMIKNIDEAMNK